MSIKPVDFQVMIPRTVEAAKVSSEMSQKNFAVQQQQAAAIQHRANDSLKQVYARQKPQNVSVSEKQRDGGRRDSDRKDGKDGASGDSSGESGIKLCNKPGKGIKTSTIDIKI